MIFYCRKFAIDIIYIAMASINIGVVFYFINSGFNEFEGGERELLDLFIRWLRYSAVLFFGLISASLFLMAINRKAFKRSLSFNYGFFEDLSLFCVSIMPVVAKYWIIIGSFGFSTIFIKSNLTDWCFKISWNNFIGINFIAILIASLVGYFSHRLMHTSIAWPLHRIHHESRSFNILTKFRFNPFELVVIIPFGFLFSLDLDGAFVVKLYYSWRIFHEIAIHSHYPWKFSSFLRFIIVSANDHRNHHSRHAQLLRGQNFSIDFIFWDRMFGTYKVKNLKFFSIGLNNVSQSSAFVYVRMLYDLRDFVTKLYQHLFCRNSR